VHHGGQGWYVERPHGADYLKTGYVPNVGSDSISPVPNGASETLEYALADFSVHQLAAALGNSAVADRFLQRSQNWANLFDTATGYIRPRDADGAFPPGDPVATTGGFGQSGFQEGNAAQYTWMVPQNLRALADGLGGDAAAAARLDTYFTQLNAGPDLPYHWQGNEPAFGAPWVYNSLHRPWQTQQTVRTIMDTLYVLGPGGEPGNDDLGAMSSWYVWSALGLYPQTPGVPMLVLGSPLFPRATLHGPHGRELTVTAAGAGQTYVQHLTVDGRASTRSWVDLDHVHRLDFTLGATPDQAWGSGPDDAPPSFGAGKPVFPPTTRAALAVDPAQTRLAPGGTATVSVKVDNSLGAEPATVTWQSDAPAGLTASPGGATVTAPAGGSVTTALTLTAGATVPTGYYQLGLTARTNAGAVLARSHLLVTLATPGQSIPTAYVSNYSDNTVTPVDTRTHNAGPPISVGSGPDGMTTAAGRLFVANNNTNNVTVVDLTTNAVTATVATGNVAADVAAAPDQRTVWVSDFGDGTVHPIDTSTLAVGAPVKVGGQPERLRVNPAGTELWVVDQADGTVSVVNLASRTVTSTIPVGAAPFGIAFAPDGRRAYVTNNGSGTVSVLDTAGHQVVATVPVGSGPEYVSVSPDGRTAYVAASGPGGVVPLDTATDTAGALIPTGGGTYALAFAPDGHTLWAVDSNTNDIRPVDPATNTPGAPVTVGNVPDGITVTG
jgi:YVTN family beta-propeller protein